MHERRNYDMKQLFDMRPDPSANTTDFSRAVMPMPDGHSLQITKLSMSDSGTVLVAPEETSEWERSLEQALDEKAGAWKKLAEL
jgi:hypothetical protein